MSLTDEEIKPLYIFGAGAAARETAELISAIWGAAKLTQFVVDRSDFITGPVSGQEVLLLSEITNEDRPAYYVIAVGDGATRRRCSAMCEERGLTAIRLIHPRAEISPSCRVGPGTVICAGSVVSTNVSIGKHVQINIGCTISHDVYIGDFCTVSPGVHVAGHVVIEEGAFLGVGAVIINGSSSRPLVIGANAIVAAGACVIRDVCEGCIVAGVPATEKH